MPMAKTQPAPPNVDAYLLMGCMRCALGGTPKCKVLPWREELILLREIVLQSGLTEEIKWGVPVYTLHGKNVLSVNALKDSANIGFFKGALLSDTHQLLQQQGTMQSDRLIKFRSTEEILPLREVLASYIREAIRIEESGAKVVFVQNPEPIPDELRQAFEEDPELEQAFKTLSPGKQRGYIIHFSKPKQSQTRIARIQQWRAAIMRGEGMQDGYKQ